LGAQRPGLDQTLTLINIVPVKIRKGSKIVLAYAMIDPRVEVTLIRRDVAEKLELAARPSPWAIESWRGDGPAFKALAVDITISNTGRGILIISYLKYVAHAYKPTPGTLLNLYQFVLNVYFHVLCLKVPCHGVSDRTTACPCNEGLTVAQNRRAVFLLRVYYHENTLIHKRKRCNNRGYTNFPCYETRENGASP